MKKITKEDLLKAYEEYLKLDDLTLNDVSKKEGSLYYAIMNKNPENVFKSDFSYDFQGKLTIRSF